MLRFNQVNPLEKSVSVIIPVLNASLYIDDVLEALLNQSYSPEATEIIFIDNGSADETTTIIENYPVTLLLEHDKAGPYAARNKGFQKAKGEIIALLDANKIPDNDWLKEGIEALERENADLAGGEILFDLNDRPTASEVYDAITFNNNRRLVLTERGSAAGNLFFRRALLDTMGEFPGGFRSGMDIWWTQQAVRNNCKLIFAEKAIVYCKPRKFRQVLRKSFRVGKTHPFNMKQNGYTTGYIINRIFRTFAPPEIRSVSENMKKINQSESSLLQVWTVAWLSKICMGCGRCRGLFSMGKHVD
jgi:glycosyltransferase AglE